MDGGESRNRTGVDGFAIRCITTLLSRHKEKSCFENNLILNGAGNESRTRDLNLGKVALYQLSYSRIIQNTVFLERETSLELATSTLARLRSTN